jgi:hypothetical protein
MRQHIGVVTGLYRYPVKSMAGEALASSAVGWHGLAGDRRLALRRTGDRGGFPWLTASKLPTLVCHAPCRRGADPGEELPTHIRTPDGQELGTFSDALAQEIGERHGSPVEMTHLSRGIFDEACVSVITSATVERAAELAALPPDVRRFRPNVVLTTTHGDPFEEDAWVGGTLVFGTGVDAAVLAITNWDERCSMVNLDPDSAAASPALLKAIVRERNNRAGVYAAVVQRGQIVAGQSVFLEHPATHRT